MDERHWWIAGKIQESFHIGGYDNPTLLEDFLSELETLDMINQFLNPGGPCRLFLYSDKPESGVLSTRELHVTGSLGSLKDLDLENVTILYFLRKNVEVEVDVAHIEKDIFCGEVKGNTIESLTSLLGDIYVPLIKARKDWKQCTADGRNTLILNLDKTLTSLTESCVSTHSSKHVMLKHPESVVGVDFKQHRLAALDQHIISEYESLVANWMSTIEQILADTADERFMDPNAGPLSELERWRRRQRLLTSITEQLKSKSCKSVIGVLITAKSKLLKKWKLIDSSITDAMNDTKDKVRYLEGLKRYLDQLYGPNATPSNIINNALPGLSNAVKQMDSISRFYARQGFLGLLFTKVTNQLVLACKDYIQDSTIDMEGKDCLWQRVEVEISRRDPDQHVDPSHKHFHSQLETKLKGSQLKPATKKTTTTDTTDESLYARLRGCLSLQNVYRDTLRSLRDSLGATHNLSHFTSLSSLGGPGSTTGRSKLSAPGSKQTTRVSTSPSKKTASVMDYEGHGVSVADEETIMSHLDSFCTRIRKIVDIVNTLCQYSRMIKCTMGLPRPRQEDLQYEGKEEEEPEEEEESIEDMIKQQALQAERNLHAIAEAEEVSQDIVEDEKETRTASPGEEEEEKKRQTDEAHDVVNATTGLTRKDIQLLKKYYPDIGQEGPSVADIMKEHMEAMTQSMIESVTTKTMLDVESKDKDKFEDNYKKYMTIVHELEKFLAAYLHAIFIRKMTTPEALNLMNKFVAIQQRPGVRMVITEKFVDIFTWYESDLEEIRQLYEKLKTDPPLLRNAPPVAGAIQWSRQLMKKIEDPMRAFRENKSISHLRDFSRIIRIYNRLATTLVTFESLWFTHWKASIDQAKNGLRATLFVHHPDTREIMVNADEKVLQLIQEAKWLTKLGILIPESAQQIMQQENRFKGYRDHLELCLKDYNEVVSSIPESLKGLFEQHIDNVSQNFQPGLSTLAWNSMNIDAFLHQIHTGTDKLKLLVDQVNDIMTHKVEQTIEKIKDMIFFDYKLAFSKSWPPQEFTQVMGESIKQRSQQLYDYIWIIESGVRECAQILANRRSKSQLTSRERVTPAGEQTPNRSDQEEKIVSGLLGQYHDDIYAAILLATTRSLVTLAESSGCEGEAIRAASALSEMSSSRRSSIAQKPKSDSPSRVSSALSNHSQAVSVLSMLSAMSWNSDVTSEVTYLRFDVEVKFSIPNIILEPPIDSIQTALDMVGRNIMQVPQGITWCGVQNLGEKFLSMIQQDEVADEIFAQLSNVVTELQPCVKQHIIHFNLHDFLWKDDMHGAYSEFLDHDPGLPAINREVERLLKVEKKVTSIPHVFPIGCVCLHTDPIKDALHGFAMAWKHHYALVLHEEAKKKLDAAVLYRSNVTQRLELSVSSLDQLNSSLHLLEELHDMENKIDDIYLPIETMYDKLREFELRLPRNEVEEVDQLRYRWQDLLDMADEIRTVLLKERGPNFEQELDKQVKGFVVEVIQFRNAFDAQGPAVPGIPPTEAVLRLQDFQQRYVVYDAKRKTLDSVSKLFGIPCKPFPELDKTGEELELLGLLYGLFQKFLRFDERFRDTLWADVDLTSATREVESYWDECLALPSKLKDWDAYNDMKTSIQQYREVFPLLHKLASKEIRNRHWLQVMTVTTTTFQLEANIFKLVHLLQIGIIKHKTDIEEICRSAVREQELEVKLRMTEDEWTEQVLHFEQYKRRGRMFLDKTTTERLLEQLEDAEALLALMLTSRYIGPLRDEAASWAEKLKEVGQVLEIWLEVQDLWQYLEAVFNNPEGAKELPQEAKRFSRIDKSWTKMMKRAYDTRNVLQCCYGDEVPKAVVLRHMHQELEICFKSLLGYLDNKRRAFPRFYFVSDPILLAILSRPNDLESVRPHLKSLFSAICNVRLEKQSDSDIDLRTETVSRRSALTPDKTRVPTSFSPMVSSISPTRIDKRLTEIHGSQGERTDSARKSARKRSDFNLNPSITTQYISILPSELTLANTCTMEAKTIYSVEGEIVQFQQKIRLVESVESWLCKLGEGMKQSIQALLLEIIQDINSGMTCDEWPNKYPTQICRMGLLYYWTKECEQGVAELRYDRRALHSTGKRFSSSVAKLTNLLSRNTLKTQDETTAQIQRIRIENMITQSLFLRDLIDNTSSKKLRENTDFEWRKNLRLYLQGTETEPKPVLYMLDQQYSYGCEFYGAQPIVGVTALTDKCFLSMSQAISQHRGPMVTGNTGSGKTETVKGFAQTLGMFLMMFHCSDTADPTSLGKVLQGISMDGCWGCFDDIEKLSKQAVCIMIDHVQAVMGAIKAKQNYCCIADGQEVAVQSSVALFLTHNPRALPNYTLPSDVKALFRQVGLVRPDNSLILKAKCSSLQIKSPTVLALRLKLVAQLVQDQLSDDVQHHLSIASLTGVLQRASHRKKYVREDKSVEKVEKKPSDLQDASRSTSQMSTTPSNYPVPQSSSSMLATSQSAQKLSAVPGTSGALKKAGTPNPMSPAARLEHAIVAQTLLDIIGPRLSAQNYAIFRQIVRDVFAGLPEPPAGSNLAMSAHSRTYDIEAAIESTAQEHGLVAHKPWLEKCMQLYNISQVHQGIIVAGPPGSGKSTIVQNLVDALCITPRGVSRGSNRTQASNPAESNHKLLKLYPLVVDDLSLIFGFLNQNNDWVDGIFTSAWRKATRNQSTTWICMDGPLNASWSDNFTSVLDSNKTLKLASGDQMFLSNNMKLLFETDDLSQASPAVVARSGIVYVDKNVVGWKPIAKAWLENRTQQEVHVLQRAFNKTVEPVSQFVMNECRPKLPLCEVAMFQTCLDLVSAMLADNIELGGELHIERLFLFCLMWSYGGLLDDKDRKAFKDFIQPLSTALPDDDTDICYFDYYVDESGEWDPWQSKIPETGYEDNHSLLGEVFIDTVDTMRTRLLMDFACASGQNVLLVGAPGSGKTAMINDYIESRDPQGQVTKKLVSSGSCDARQLQQFIEANIYHRQGFVYGARDNKRLQMFIDDINLPQPDAYGVQRCNELLRRIMDDKILCTLTKPFEWRTLENLNFLSAMTLSQYPSVSDQHLSPRFLRHFAVFYLVSPHDSALKNIVFGILENTMQQGEQPGLDIDLHNQIVQASCQLLTAVKDVLRPTDMPGRCHYIFTLKDIVTCFHCLKRLAVESRADDKMVMSLWKHEMERVIRDRICRYADMRWYDETMETVVKDVWKDSATDLHKYFVTFPMDARVYQRPVTSMTKKEVKVVLRPVDSLRDVHNCLQTHLNRYNDEFGNVNLDIMLSENIISHIIKMHRVLSYYHGGNFLVVGPIGAHLDTLCKLALHVADIPIHHVDSSKHNTFMDGLRSAVRMTGAEGKTLTLLFNARDLQDEVYLDALNSILLSGEYPYLFTNDEMDGLLQALGPVLKREHPTVMMDLSKFFVTRVRTNLHIVLCLPPNHRLLRIAARQYPGLINGCQLIWICDWTKETLLGEAAYYLNKHALTKDCDDDISENVMSCLANIHSFVLQDCGQTKWAGDTNDTITFTSVRLNEKRKEQVRAVVKKEKNIPYSKVILQEKIKLRHKKNNAPTSSELFVGPTTFKRFMDTFNKIYSQKAKARTEQVARLKNVINTLDLTRKDAKAMKESIRDTGMKFQAAKRNTSGLLKKLTARATVLEKLKAKVGIATALSAFLQLNELSEEVDEEDNLLKHEDRDEYDEEFDRMQQNNLKTRQVQAKEEYEKICQVVLDNRQKIDHQKQQVLYLRNLVNRGVVEAIKSSLKSPTQLVSEVMDMVMTLIGKKPASDRLDTRRDIYPRDGQSTSSTSTKNVTQTSLKKGKTQKEGGDRMSFKKVMLIMNDSAKFVEMLHNVPWEDGLPDDTLAAVESYLAKGESGVTGEGSLLDNAKEKEKQFVAQKNLPFKGITIEAAKYSHEDAAKLVQYTIAIVEYTRLCGPLKVAIEKKNELEKEIKENERKQKEREKQAKEVEEESEPPIKEDLSEEDLPRVQSEVDDLQGQFDDAVEEKHSLESELNSMKERLKAATSLIENLKPHEAQWRSHITEFNNNDVLVANSIVAAAFLTYAGGMNTDTRKRMGEFFMTICCHHGIQTPAKKLFKDIELVDFLFTPLQIKELEPLKLPKTPLMLQNAAFLMQEDNLTAWPLLCDPSSWVVDWVRHYMNDKGLIQVKYSEIRSQFDTCLAEGLPLLVTDVDVHAMVRDNRFMNVVLSRQKFVAGRNPFKLQVGEHEVECQASFRMYLHTTMAPNLVPPELGAHVSLLYFLATRTDYEEYLLDRFMMLEKTRLEDDKNLLLTERLDNMKNLERLENQLVTHLSSDVRLLNDLAMTKKLTDLKEQYDETQESQRRVESNEDVIWHAREGFRVIATRGAVCCETSLYMRIVQLLYQISFQQFIDIFDTSISHSDRASIKTIVERLTNNALITTTRSLIEKDRPLYLLLLALEIEDAAGNVGLGEREYLISPSLGSVTMTALGYNQSTESKFVQAKKSFDWMTDEQFNNLQILAIHYEWFQDMFERMPKDGRETQWRTLCESDQPEQHPLPERMDDHYTRLQRMLVIRAVRSDRIMHLGSLFVQSVLGKKYGCDVLLELPLVLRQSTPRTPILMLYTAERETAEKLFFEFAERKQSKTLVVPLSGLGLSEERAAKKSLHRAINEGLWLLLQNGHNACHLLNSLEAIFAEHDTVDSQFRCWITAEATSDIPVRVLHTCVKVIIDSPKTTKDTLLRSFSMLDPEILKQSSRPEWPAMLHNLCYLHGAIRLRTRYGRGGWNIPADFIKIGNSELFEGLSLLQAEFKDNLTTMNAEGKLVLRSPSWTGIKFLLAELIYGNYITDPMDLQSLSAMIDYWISPNAVKKEFELPKLRYKHPAAFFVAVPRLAQLTQALENIPNHFLEVPEGCNIHPTVETLLGDEQYVYTRLNRVLDSMPSTHSLSHQLFPRAPTPLSAFECSDWLEQNWEQTRQNYPLKINLTIGDCELRRAKHNMYCPPMSNISTQSNNPQIVDQGVFASASLAALRMRKEIELWEICHTMLTTKPLKPFGKEYIAEKVKKIGGFTSFNMYIMKELDILNKLVVEVRSSLQAIKGACEKESLGDQLTCSQLEVADDLYHLRIPGYWRHLAGNTAPPPNQALGTWLSDLQNRCQQFDRILSLGREKTPAYWLGAFFYPRGLLALLKQDCYRHHAADRSGNFDQYVFQTEITARDKDHIRDPPAEGMFVFGIYIWGCAWEKTTGDLVDSPPRHSCAALPVVHLTCWSLQDKPLLQDSSKAAELYACPVYQSRIAPRESILELDVCHSGIPATRWALRGLSATVRPF